MTDALIDPKLEAAPCPFCGQPNPSTFKNTVVCKSCSASGPDLGDTNDRPGAIAAWNRRAASPQTELNQLREALRPLADLYIGVSMLDEAPAAFTVLGQRGVDNTMLNARDVRRARAALATKGEKANE